MMTQVLTTSAIAAINIVAGNVANVISKFASRKIFIEKADPADEAGFKKAKRNAAIVNTVATTAAAVTAAAVSSGVIADVWSDGSENTTTEGADTDCADHTA